MSFPASNSVVLRQVLDRAQVSSVSGLLGVAVASYLDVAAELADPAEPELFASLSSTHRAAVHAERNFAWCLERFGADVEVVDAAALAHATARQLDEAFRALEVARRRPARWRVALRLARRPDGSARGECARAYAHAAMAHGEQVERLRSLLADR
jgi:hypothetical protein